MAMDRFRRVAGFWNWLPAFRGVAEHESIHQAASSLGVSASALSRTVKLLEDAMGVELFVRHAGGLRLTDAGRDLLVVARDSMRAADDLVARWHDDAVSATLTIGCVSDVVAVAIAAALPTPTESSRLVVREISAEGTESDLLQGNIDLAIATEPIAGSDTVECRAIGQVRLGIYATASGAEPAAALVVPSGLDVDIDGAVVARVSSVSVARALAVSAGARVVLPDEPGTTSGLVRLDEELAPLALHAWHRRPLGPSPAVDRLRAVISSVEARLLAGTSTRA